MTLTRRQACTILTLGGIALYMLALLDVPLFYDEIALRIRLGRGFIEGFSFGSFFPECKALPVPTPWLLLPAHWVLSWMDGVFAWQAVRVLPLFALTLVLALVVLCVRRAPNPRGLLLLCGGFIGLSGVGVILSRPEYLNLLHVAAILGTLLLAKRAHHARGLVALVIVAHLFVASASLLAHLQGLLLVPFSFISCMRLLHGHRGAAFLVGFFLAALSMQTLSYSHMNCPADPALVQALEETQGSGIARLNVDYSLPYRMAKQGYRYAMQFIFHESPQNYSIPMPPAPKLAGRAVNAFVLVLILLNALGLVVVGVVSARNLWRRYRWRMHPRAWRGVINDLVADEHFLLFSAVAGLVLYSLYELSGAFYRADFRNFLSVVLLVLAMVHVTQPRLKRWLTGWAVLAVVGCLLSSALLWTTAVPALRLHQAFVGVPLDQDWDARARQVTDLAKRCGLKTDVPGVIVDDLTYEPLKASPQPYGFHYLWYGDGLKGVVRAETPRQRESRVRAEGLPGMLVRCTTAKYVYDMPVTHRSGDLCCKAYR